MMDFLKEFEQTGSVANHKNLLPVYFKEVAGQSIRNRAKEITKLKETVFKYKSPELFDIKDKAIPESQIKDAILDMCSRGEKLIKDKQPQVMLKELKKLGIEIAKLSHMFQQQQERVKVKSKGGVSHGTVANILPNS